MIDFHCHVFNLRYVPVVGILRKWGIPDGVAEALGAIFIAITATDPSLDRSVRSRALTRETLARRMARTAPTALMVDPRLLAAVSPEHRAALRAAAAAPQARASRVSFERAVEDLVQQGIDRSSAGVGGIRLVWLMTHAERDIFALLRRTYPDVRLFVHHMMDMALHYDDKPDYDFVTQQIPRLRKLGTESGGALVGFVAYSPLREHPVDVVRLACQTGFLGVKFYPPSGYRPIGNESAIPGGDEIDKKNRELFDYCVRAEIPILSHCTAHGFEAGPGFGCYSDPAGWERVLRIPEFQRLRLCLGHAGGASGWFAPNDADGDAHFAESYAGAVYRLCSDPALPNVYCDMAYLEEVLDPERARTFGRRLERLVLATPAFARRIIYGSDWHMLFKEAGCERYRQAFAQVFANSPVLAPLNKAFFVDNALAFLNLRGFVSRSGSLLSPVERKRLTALATKKVGSSSRRGR